MTAQPKILGLIVLASLVNIGLFAYLIYRIDSMDRRLAEVDTKRIQTQIDRKQPTPKKDTSVQISDLGDRIDPPQEMDGCGSCTLDTDNSTFDFEGYDRAQPFPWTFSRIVITMDDLSIVTAVEQTGTTAFTVNNPGENHSQQLDFSPGPPSDKDEIKAIEVYFKDGNGNEFSPGAEECWLTSTKTCAFVWQKINAPTGP